MPTAQRTRFLNLIIFAVCAQVACGQSPQSLPALAPTVKPRQSNVEFTFEKPVLGFPFGATRPRVHCSVDGTAFFDPAANSAKAGQDLYGISPDGNVKHLLRKLPNDFTDVSVLDIFTGDKQIVTLLRADKRDDSSETSPPHERDYFLSLEDTAGDLSDLVPLRLTFKPLRIARFASGDIVVLGWDEGNLLPVLATLNLDGTPHRFIDFEVRQTNAKGEVAAHTDERATQEALEGASFVAFSGDILLTYPGTTKPVRKLTAAGESFTIPISIPGGYALNDVLVSSGRTLIVRVKEWPPLAASGPTDAHPRMRVFEENAYNGGIIREFIFTKPNPEDLTCAPNSSLSAIFFDTIPDPSRSEPSDPAAAPPTQLVVATMRR